ncbi:hypothetical protein BGZ50_009394 [Haplosporangium sp. Z 11]|nr:hypothetical protein BGZ50_009394 [Haplosporangium sp. Z 11]
MVINSSHSDFPLASYNALHSRNIEQSTYDHSSSSHDIFGTGSVSATSMAASHSTRPSIPISNVASSRARSHSGLTSPALSHTSATTSHSRKRKSPEPDHAPESAPAPTDDKKSHKYDDDQEIYLAKLISTPETWALLEGPGKKNSYHMSKAQIRRQLAQKMNGKKFIDRETGLVVTFDEGQIKNKITSMAKQYQQTVKFQDKTGGGSKNGFTLAERILKRCCFYYIVDPVWSKSWALNPRQPMQSTSKRPGRMIRDSDTDENDENDEVEEYHDEVEDYRNEDEDYRNEDDRAATPRRSFSDRMERNHASSRSSAPPPAKISKKRHEPSQGESLLKVLGTLAAALAEGQELQRQRLEFEMKKVEADRQVRMEELRLKERQLRSQEDHQLLQVQMFAASQKGLPVSIPGAATGSSLSGNLSPLE